MLEGGDELSPVFESPLGLFDPETLARTLEANMASRRAI